MNGTHLTGADNTKTLANLASREDPFQAITKEEYGNLSLGLPNRASIQETSRPAEGSTINQNLERTKEPLLRHTEKINETDVTYDLQGNVQGYQVDGQQRTFVFNHHRQLQSVGITGSGKNIDYEYDPLGRRIKNTGSSLHEPLIYAWQGSRVIAIGRATLDKPKWLYAIAYGPAGPVFMKSLSAEGKDYYLITDHLGTPYAYQNADDPDDVSYTFFSPWGQPHNPVLKASTGQVKAKDEQYKAETKELPTPEFAGLESHLFGLGGHLYDTTTGMTYMHHRYYDPTLGHFLNPDFRPEDIYDPTTITEPCAYAAGNPTLFWDPDGLDPTLTLFNKTLADFGGNEDLYTEALIRHLSQTVLLSKPYDKYPGFTNFDSNSSMFNYITTVVEFARGNLAIVSEFKEFISGARQVIVLRPVHGQISLVGPQLSNGIIHKGGAIQI